MDARSEIDPKIALVCAALIAQSKSNSEISAAVVISEKTNERHIANILRKLDFSSRPQIAAWAMRKGLRHPDSAAS